MSAPELFPTEGMRPAVAADRDHVVDILVHAFGADPIMRWALGPDDFDRRLRVLFTHLIGDGILPFGRSSIALDGSLASIVLGPGDHISEAFWLERTERLTDELGGDVDRLVALNATSEERVPAEPHWNMFAVGIRPGSQNTGLASVLVDGMLAEIDRRGEPMYGEATNPHSRDVSTRYGFDIVDEFNVLDSPPMWTIWRTPGAPRRR